MEKGAGRGGEKAYTERQRERVVAERKGGTASEGTKKKKGEQTRTGKKTQMMGGERMRERGRERGRL